MGFYDVEITPFDIDGTYSEPIEVTEDVDLSSFSTINRQIENNEFDVGLFGFDNVSLGVRNEHGRFSDTDVDQSIFKFKRADSIVEFYWRAGPTAWLGSAVASVSALGPRYQIFSGLLNDDSATMAIDQQRLAFKVLGLDSILGRVIIPTGTVTNGTLISEAIYEILNQSEITSLLTVEQANISVAVDVAVDVATELNEITVKDALDELLFLSNSVMYLENRTVFVKPRSPIGEVKKTFYGQASHNGIENILQIGNIRKGLNRTFNRWVWKETNLVAQDSSSITMNGTRIKQIESNLITNNTSRQSILDALLEEFKDPKLEFSLITTATESTLELNLLDKVSVDYPTVAIGEEGDIPTYGLSQYGQAVYPKGIWSLTIGGDKQFKIMGFQVDVREERITLKLREA